MRAVALEPRREVAASRVSCEGSSAQLEPLVEPLAGQQPRLPAGAIVVQLDNRRVDQLERELAESGGGIRAQEAAGARGAQAAEPRGLGLAEFESAGAAQFAASGPRVAPVAAGRRVGPQAELRHKEQLPVH